MRRHLTLLILNMRNYHPSDSYGGDSLTDCPVKNQQLPSMSIVNSSPINSPNFKLSFEQISLFT